MKKMLSYLFAALCAVFAASSWAETKIGIFDLNRILLQIPQAKDTQQKLQNKFATRDQEVALLQQKLSVDADDYNNSSLTTTDVNVLRKKQEIVAAEQQELQFVSAKLEHDFNIERNKSLQPLLSQVDRVIAKIAQQQKLDVTIALTGVAYHDAALEITDQIIAEMKNAALSKVKHVIKSSKIHNK